MTETQDNVQSNGDLAEVMTSARPAKASKAQLDGKAEDIFRGMWASLFYSGKISGKAVMLTSAARGEGATTAACALAISGSGPAGGAKVALVDFNLRQPAVHKTLGLPQGPGLTEVLLGGQDIDSVARRVNDNLDVFTVGALEKKSLGLLRSDAVRKFFDQLAEKYDHVLIDAAAVNHYPDAQVLAGVLKEAVLVVHSDITPREAVGQAKKRIVAGGGKLVGLVMNMRTYPIPNFLYNRV